MALLVGNNTNETSNIGLTNGVVRLKATAFVASASGTATSAFVKVIDWADEITSRAKVVVWDSGGTVIGISDPITVPITTAAFVSAAFSSPFSITNGLSYYLGVIVQSGTVDCYHSAATFACTDAGGTYSYASPGGATITGSTANAGIPAIYLDGTASGGTPTVDGWGTRQADVVRPRSAAQRGGASPLGPLPIPPVAPALNAPVYPDRHRPRPRATQFLEFTAPRHVPDVTQPVTALSWGARYLDRPARARRLPDAPLGVAPLHVPDVTQPVVAQSWGPDYQDQVARKPALHAARQQALAWASTQIAAAAVPTLAQPQFPDWVARPGRRAITSVTEPEYGYEVDVPVMSWTGSELFPAWVARKRTVAPRSVVVSTVSPIVGPVVAPDLSWAPEFPDRLPRRQLLTAQQLAHVWEAFVPDVTQAVTARSWSPHYPDFARARRIRAAIHEVTFRDKFDPPVAPAAPALSWSPSYPNHHNPVAALLAALRPFDGAWGVYTPVPDNWERYIRPNPIDGGTVGTSLRGRSTLGTAAGRLRPILPTDT